QLSGPPGPPVAGAPFRAAGLAGGDPAAVLAVVLGWARGRGTGAQRIGTHPVTVLVAVVADNATRATVTSPNRTVTKPATGGHDHRAEAVLTIDRACRTSCC